MGIGLRLSGGSAWQSPASAPSDLHLTCVPKHVDQPIQRSTPLLASVARCVDWYSMACEEPGSAGGWLASSIALVMDSRLEPNAMIGRHEHPRHRGGVVVLDHCLTVTTAPPGSGNCWPRWAPAICIATMGCFDAPKALQVESVLLAPPASG